MSSCIPNLSTPADSTGDPTKESTVSQWKDTIKRLRKSKTTSLIVYYGRPQPVTLNSCLRDWNRRSAITDWKANSSCITTTNSRRISLCQHRSPDALCSFQNNSMALYATSLSRSEILVSGFKITLNLALWSQSVWSLDFLPHIWLRFVV